MEQFIVRDIKQLTLESGKDVSWTAGDLLNISTSHALKSPDVFKILLFEDIDEKNVGKEFKLVETNKYDYLNGILPSDSSGSYLLGSDCNSAIVLYGEKDQIIEAEKIIENALFSKVGTMQEEDFDMGGFSYFIWNLESGKSLLIVQNDEMYVMPLRDSFNHLKLVLVGSGGHADDVLAGEFLVSALMKDIVKVRVDADLDEDYIEDYEDSDFYADYITCNGKAIKKKDKPAVLELAYVLCCDLLKQHEVVYDEDDWRSAPNTVEAAKRIKKLYDTSQTPIAV